MSIPRFHAYHSGDPHKVGLWADKDGYWVQYAEHVAAVTAAKMDAFHWVQQGQRDERERIRRKVNAVMSKASAAWREPLAFTMDMILTDGEEEASDE